MIARAGRRDLTLNQDQTRITPLSEGFNFIGFELVKRRRPRTLIHALKIPKFSDVVHRPSGIGSR